MRYIILGTAGHIDHGKSSLVKALTGIDPDRLKEEKERGITIDIGFADLQYPEHDLAVGIVDVPGHEKLISNMLAGAGGIDLVLMVIAADEGIMPQSREHLAICNMLKIKSGLVAVTKTDLVEKDWLSLVVDEIRDFVRGTFLDGAPVIPVSSRTGENLGLLRDAIRERAENVAPKRSGGLFRMPIDRVFTLKGFGTVITGTAISGKVSVDDPLAILPADIMTKARGIHSHGRGIQTACAGQRVAINLQGVEKENLRRGDVAVTPGRFQPTRSADVFLELIAEAPPLKDKSLVHLYVNTSETIARVILYEKQELKPGESAYCQFRLQDPVIAVSGDRYIIRRFSPLETMGGGEVLDPSPSRRRRKEGIEDLRKIRAGDLGEKLSLKIGKAGIAGISVHDLHGWIEAEPERIEETVKGLREQGEILQHEDILIHRDAAAALRARISSLLSAFHRGNPLKPGMPKEEIRTGLKISPKLFNLVVSEMKDVSVDRDLLRLGSFKIALSGNEEAQRARILSTLEKAGYLPPLAGELLAALKMDQKQFSDIMKILAKEGSVVRISDTIYLHASSYASMIAALRKFFAAKPEITVAEFRDLLNTSRKYALPFLEYLDASKVTIRTGDVRKLIMRQ